MLDQPREKRSSIKIEILIKGKRDNIQDVIAVIANIVVFARYFIKMEIKHEDQPYIVQLTLEIADYFYQQNTRISTRYSKRYINNIRFDFLICNMFSTFTKLVKNIITW